MLGAKQKLAFVPFANELNSENSSVKNIILKYYNPGHTFMSADSFHHQVEQGLRQRGMLKISNVIGKLLMAVENLYIWAVMISYKLQRDYPKQNAHATSQN